MKLCNPLVCFFWPCLCCFFLFFLSSAVFLLSASPHSLETKQFSSPHSAFSRGRGLFFSSLSFYFILIPKHMIAYHIGFVFLALETLGFIYLLLLKSAQILGFTTPPTLGVPLYTSNWRVHISFQLVCVDLLVGQVRVNLEKKKRILHCAKNVNV